MARSVNPFSGDVEFLVPGPDLKFSRQRVSDPPIFGGPKTVETGVVDVRHILDEGLERAKSRARETIGEARGEAKRLFLQRIGLAIQGMAEKAVDAALTDIKLDQMDVAPVKQELKRIRTQLAKVVADSAADSFSEIVKSRIGQIMRYAQEQAGTPTSNISHALPNGTKLMVQHGGMRMYFVETPPGVRTVRFDGQPYRLSFPYVVLGILIDSGNRYCGTNVFFRKERLASLDSKLLLPAFSNVHWPDCRLCDGAESLSILQGKNWSTAADVVEKATEMFWETSFQTRDWPDALQSNMSNVFGQTIHYGLDAWLERTKSDPGFALRANWSKLPDERYDTPNKAFNTRGIGLGNATTPFNLLQQEADELTRRIRNDAGTRIAEKLIEDKDARMLENNLIKQVQEQRMGERVGAHLREELKKVVTDDLVVDILTKVASMATDKMVKDNFLTGEMVRKLKEEFRV